jgi:hypothetical protein
VEALEAAIDGLPVGDPAAAGTQVGPVIDEGARARMLEAAEEASRAGGTLVRGGKAAPGAGWMVEPTLVTGLGPEAALNQREVFAPFATVIAARDLDDAIAIVNGVEYGLRPARAGQGGAGVLHHHSYVHHRPLGPGPPPEVAGSYPTAGTPSPARGGRARHGRADDSGKTDRRRPRSRGRGR